MYVLIDALIDAGLGQLGHIMYGTRSLWASYNRIPYVITFVDEENLPENNIEIYREIDKKIAEEFKKVSNEVRHLKVIFSKNIDISKAILENERNIWYVDDKENKLIILENQPRDFLKMRDIIERYLKEREEYTENEEADKKSIFSWFNKDVVTITKLLILINVLLFVIPSMLGYEVHRQILENFGITLDGVLNRHEWYRLFTYMFLQFDGNHLVGNMISLFAMGEIIEKTYKKANYMLIYFGGGLMASVLTVLYYSAVDRTVISAGASGAISALIGSLAAGLIYDLVKRKNNGNRNNYIFAFFLCIVLQYVSDIKAGHVNVIAHASGLVWGIIVTLIILASKAGKQKD